MKVLKFCNSGTSRKSNKANEGPFFMKLFKFYNSGKSRKSNKANKGPFFIDSVKNKSEGKFLIPAGTFFKS